MKNLLHALILAFFYPYGIINTQAQDTSIIVHEWGTFTAKYDGSGRPYTNLHQQEDESLPSFVHSIDFSKPLHGYAINEKDYGNELDGAPMSLTHVSIKMETPVLYFYSPFAFQQLGVHVNFNQGSISQFYPMPFEKEDTNTIKNQVNEILYSPVIYHGVSGTPELNFSKYNGYASWKVNILAPDAHQPPTHKDDSVPHLWLMPRKTSANMIESNGIFEHYIFYRGLGGFENPVVPCYTDQGNMVIRNNYHSDIPFVMVYEKDKDGGIFIWNIGKIEAFKSLKVLKSRQKISASDWRHTYRASFINNLVDAGLYKDEAEAMLNTWDSSYFGKPGVKIFWIVPRVFTDRILPIGFTAPVKQLERVMVGRTEIDPYNQGNSLYIKDSEPLPENRKYTVFPNPVTDAFYIRHNDHIQEMVELKLIDLLGREIQHCKLLMLPYVDNSVPMDVSDIPPGIYFIVLKDQNGEKIFKISFQ